LAPNEDNHRSNSRPRPNTQVLNDSYELHHMSKLEETPPPAFIFKTTKQMIISPCVQIQDRDRDN
tara:strand:- start:71 stop:265 length:195 start_codon:yes stop_codon:yes gene_type:complete